jgi:hypothetical protein
LQGTESFDNRRALRRDRGAEIVIPDVRQHLTISDGAVNQRGRGQNVAIVNGHGAFVAAAVGSFLLFVAAAGGCGPMVETAPFAVRPDSVRPGDLLGPYDGIVTEMDSDRPVAGAVVAASWAFERGIGFRAPYGTREVVVETGADGRYLIPRLADFPDGLSSRIRRFTLIVYHRGHVGWRSDRLYPGRQLRRDFSQRGARVHLERWQPTYTHADHVVFVGGGARVRAATSWELQAAALELEGERNVVVTGAPGEPQIATTVTPLDVTHLLSDDEIRGVTGYTGKFDDGKLTDLPTTEFYDSRHFKAVQKPESYDVGVRVWRLGTAAAEVQFGKLMSTLPEAHVTDEVGDTSFRTRQGSIDGIVFLVRERGVVVSLTCGSAQCTEPGHLLRLGKLVESHIPELPNEQARGAAVPAGEQPADDTTKGETKGGGAGQ